jgi:hypothetical protein
MGIARVVHTPFKPAVHSPMGMPSNSPPSGYEWLKVDGQFVKVDGQLFAVKKG